MPKVIRQAEAKKLLAKLDENGGGKLDFGEVADWFGRTCASIETFRQAQNARATRGVSPSRKCSLSRTPQRTTSSGSRTSRTAQHSAQATGQRSTFSRRSVCNDDQDILQCKTASDGAARRTEQSAAPQPELLSFAEQHANSEQDLVLQTGPELMIIPEPEPEPEPEPQPQSQSEPQPQPQLKSCATTLADEAEESPAMYTELVAAVQELEHQLANAVAMGEPTELLMDILSELREEVVASQGTVGVAAVEKGHTAPGEQWRRKIIRDRVIAAAIDAGLDAVGLVRTHADGVNSKRARGNSYMANGTQTTTTAASAAAAAMAP